MPSSAMRPQDLTHARGLRSAQQAPLSTSSSAAGPSSVGRSDIISTSDFSNPTLGQTPRLPLTVIPVPRSSSLAPLMGQGQARPDASLLPEATSPLASKGFTFTNVAVATGHKLKRALAGRLKKSDNIPVISTSSGKEEKAKRRQDHESPSPSPLNARFLASHVNAFGNKKLPKRPSSPLPPSSPSPSPVPTRDALSSSPPHLVPNNQRSSIGPLSPSISLAGDGIRKAEDKEQEPQTSKSNQGRQENSQQTSDSRDEWRKSDSTMTAKLGSHRTSRPVSMAESVQSTQTIVPNAQHRSSLISDTSLGMTEESDSSDSQLGQTPSLSASAYPSLRVPSLTPSKIQNPYSLSLDRTPSPSSPTAPSQLNRPPASISSLEMSTRTSTSSTDSPTLLHTAADAFISTGRNVRGRLTAWTAANTVAPFPRQSQALPTSGADPLSSLRSGLLLSHRQTKTSLTGSFAPATGLAKRAVEKMGRAFGGITSSSSSVYSSASTTSSPTSQSSSFTSENVMSRYDSPQSTAPATEKTSRKPPHVPSWSVSSSVASSTADLDATPDGPYLGHQLRPPLRRANNGANVAGGLVFGRDLRACCRETAINVVGRSVQSVAAQRHTMATSLSGEQDVLRALENRMVPAIVVRCAQHLLLWGVHEEGLFRINGRSLHVSKLRSEFDTGADYDMSECGPGDLDPHAVASAFKAYLRELPEPILTRSLLSQFEAAITAESNATDRNLKGSSFLGRGFKGPSLPAGPRNGLRKPPSLSTLALPNFSASKPPSRTLVETLRSLITQLPDENRDLIRTVAELIKTTAQHSKETKMPLSNLLLIFCPSLNMNPPLLRVLCECDGIWEDLPSTPLDIDNAVTDLGTPGPHNTKDVITSKAISNGQQATLDADATQDAANEARSVLEISTLRSATIERTGPIPTVYLDAESCASSLGPLGDADSMSSKDNVSYVSTLEEPPMNSSPSSVKKPHSDLPPLPLTDSVVTSTSSFSYLPIPTNLFSKPQSVSAPGSPLMAESTRRSFLSGKPAISSPITSPVQFPLTGPIPQPPIPITRRRSDPILPPPTFTIQSADPAPHPPSSNRVKRLKKPSLNLLFVKPMTSVPSATSLISFSPYLHGLSASDSSSSTPTSAVTAKTSNSVTNLAPVLDTQIDSSPLGLVLSGEDDKRQDFDRTEAPSKSGAQGSSPVAVKYPTPITPMQSFYDASDAARTPVPRTQPPQRISPSRPDVTFKRTSFTDHLGEVVKPDSSDWTRSVLVAAEVDSKWLPQHAGGNLAATPLSIL